MNDSTYVTSDAAVTSSVFSIKYLIKAKASFVALREHFLVAQTADLPYMRNYVSETLAGIAPFEELTAENAEEIKNIVMSAGDKHRAEIVKPLIDKGLRDEIKVLHDALHKASAVIMNVNIYLEFK